MIEHRPRPPQTQDARVDKGVVDDNIGVHESMQGQNREQPGISRAGPDEPDMAGFEIRQTERCAVEQFVGQGPGKPAA